MKFVLRFVAVFNVLAGLFMLIGYHETYKIIGMEKPDISFPIQLVGILVGLFGVGYYMVARNPIENRAVLLLGFWSKFLGSCLGTYYVIRGELPLTFGLGKAATVDRVEIHWPGRGVPVQVLTGLAVDRAHHIRQGPS